MQEWLNRLSGKWWFYLVLLLITFVPPYTAKPYDPAKSAGVVIAVLSNAMVYSWKWLFPLAKIVPLVAFGALALRKGWAARAFHIYAALNFLIVGLFENMASTPQYGFAVLIGNVAVCLLVAASWLWEGIVKQGDFSRARWDLSRVWVLLPAFIAFWYPIDMVTLQPSFRLLYLISSEAGVTFCMMLPVYLAVMILFYPKVNIVTLRVTGFSGLIVGLLSAVQFFVMNEGMTWMGALHLPLLIISAYSFVRSFRRDTSPQGREIPAGA